MRKAAAAALTPKMQPFTKESLWQLYCSFTLSEQRAVDAVLIAFDALRSVRPRAARIARLVARCHTLALLSWPLG